MPPTHYELLDFGAGRKLERFGPLVLDRPTPAASDVEVGNAAWWSAADARFIRRDAASGDWTVCAGVPATWNLEHAPLVLELQCTPSGAVAIEVTSLEGKTSGMV